MSRIRNFCNVHSFGIGVTFLIVGFALLTISAVCTYCSKSAKLINAKYGTEYTASDIFWTGEIIREIIVGTQHNIDLKK